MHGNIFTCNQTSGACLLVYLFINRSLSFKHQIDWLLSNSTNRVAISCSCISNRWLPNRSIVCKFSDGFHAKKSKHHHLCVLMDDFPLDFHWSALMNCCGILSLVYLAIIVSNFMNESNWKSIDCTETQRVRERENHTHRHHHIINIKQNLKFSVFGYLFHSSLVSVRKTEWRYSKTTI